MTQVAAAGPRRFRAIVFKRAPSTSDFSCSEQILLPGEHSEEGARMALGAALRGPAGGGFIGGEIRPV